MASNSHPGNLWTAEERAWALECFTAGDSVADIADAADRPFLDVALALNVYGYVHRERRWQASPATPGSVRQARWIGGMLREVAVYRCRHGEEPRALAAVAQASRTSMFDALKGLVKRRRRLPTAVEPRAA